MSKHIKIIIKNAQIYWVRELIIMEINHIIPITIIIIQTLDKK